MRYFNNSIFLELDTSSKDVVKGVIKSGEIEAVAFNDVNQLLVLFDEVCNQLLLPQSSMQLRSFPNKEKERVIEFEKKEVANIELNENQKILQVIITKRQNASWQGYVVFEEGRMDFNSELEFINILRNFINE